MITANETALTAADGQTCCLYKGLASYYDIGCSAPSGLVLSGRLARGRRISGLISFEPDRAEVYLDGTRLRLEPGQAVIPHGPDRDLTTRRSGRPGGRDPAAAGRRGL